MTAADVRMNMKEASGTGDEEDCVIHRFPLSLSYNMKHKRRGIAYIFNHEVFYIKGFDPRSGTRVDSAKLSGVLEGLGFQVKVRHDLMCKDIMKKITKVAKMDHSEHDCVLITVLTHGERGKLYAKDTNYNPEKLWKPFTDDKCPTLAGKPKLFFIQACQGNTLDDGITLTRGIETDGANASWLTTTHPDFLIMTSTIPGYYSWRNNVNGSWFIETLCEKLAYDDAEVDILFTLTLVSQQVALNYESKCDNPVFRQKKQIPCINSTLLRKLVFGKKK